MTHPTICAVSTGSGRAGIAVVRVSGPVASVAVKQLAGDLSEPRRFTPRALYLQSGELLDRGVVIWLPGPNTVTGEDVAEFHVHGSPAVVQGLLTALQSIDGVRLAEPGEFTRRAFHNGRLDLLEVEGLGDLLEAQSAAQRQLALRQFTGEASARVEIWRGSLIRSLALLEAAIDFSDEDDVALRAKSDALNSIADLKLELEAAVVSSGRASAIRRGLRIVVGGAPNVGKSSLVNALAGRDAAIVSALPGTTRDIVDAPLRLAGLDVVLSDTAGLRAETADDIELEGMSRSRAAMAKADILVWVVASDQLEQVGPPRSADLIVNNKIDLDPIRKRNDSVAVSVKTGEGLDMLGVSLSELVKSRSVFGENDVFVRERHRLAVEESIRFLNDALKHSDAGLEIVAEDVRNAAHALGLVTGRVGVEDLLDKIFRDFCIGK